MPWRLLVSHKRDFRAEDFALYHPAGASAAS